MKNTNERSKKNSKKKWVFLSVGLAATGALSYFGWQYWQKYRDQATSGDSPAIIPPATTTTSTYTPPKTTYTTSTPAAGDDFPLKKGSKGAKVKALQEVLIAEHGKSIMPKYGADGDFGSETVAALKKLKLPEVIDESTYNVIVKGGTVDAAKTSKDLLTAVTNKNLSSTLAVLKTLKSTTDYEIVNTVFKTNYIGGVRKTIVNAVLDTFSLESQKQQIRLALVNIGLKYDGEKWSLSGIDDTNLIITLQPTRVWQGPKTSVAVPSSMVLGKLVATKGNFTLFESEANYFLVQSNHVGYYKIN